MKDEEKVLEIMGISDLVEVNYVYKMEHEEDAIKHDKPIFSYKEDSSVNSLSLWEVLEEIQELDSLDVEKIFEELLNSQKPIIVKYIVPLYAPTRAPVFAPVFAPIHAPLYESTRAPVFMTTLAPVFAPTTKI